MSQKINHEKRNRVTKAIRAGDVASVGHARKTVVVHGFWAEKNMMKVSSTGNDRDAVWVSMDDAVVTISIPVEQAVKLDQRK